MRRTNRTCAYNDLSARFSDISSISLARIGRLDVHPGRTDSIFLVRELDLANDRVRADLQALLALVREPWGKESVERRVPLMLGILADVQQGKVCSRGVRRVGVWNAWNPDILDSTIGTEWGVNNVVKTNSLETTYYSMTL